MHLKLTNTNAAAISSEMRKAQRHIGTSSGLVFTLIVVVDSGRYSDALEAVQSAARAHPSRVLIVVSGSGKTTKLDADITLGESIPGSIVTLRVSGELVTHADSVLIPLLLPDSPIVVWWPNESPENPAEDRIGKLADRRITDAAGVGRALEALRVRAENHSHGDTDLTWTRLTPWRALLAASLDQYPSRVLSARVEASRDNAPAELLASWLQSRLDVEVTRTVSQGPGVTAVRMQTPAGDIALLRSDGLLASYEVPGEPRRSVALKRRELSELLAEELGRVDTDDIFDAACRTLIERRDHERSRATTKKTTGKKTTTKKTPTKKAPSKKTTTAQAGADQ